MSNLGSSAFAVDGLALEWDNCMDPIVCLETDSLEESNVETARLRSKLNDLHTFDDVREWIRDADALQLWSHSAEFEVAYSDLANLVK